ncbi:hypothetical protein F4859DRAFT_166552 [Xylaria cf. heliscus]|nr:hypothetical protein F4859DRAFT_166552 [Xylaria cf. heliscus]
MPTTLLLRATPRRLPCSPGRRPNVGRVFRRHQSSPPSPASSPTSASPKDLPKSATQAEASKASQAGPGATNPTPAPPSFWLRLGPLTRMGQAYERARRTRPYTTQVISTLAIWLCADVASQSMGGGALSKSNDKGEDKGAVAVEHDDGTEEEHGRKHDWGRTARTLAIGGAISIPSYMWYRYLARSFNYPSSKVLSIAAKVVVNQVTFTPVFNVYFFGSHALLSGDTADEAWRRVCNTVPVSYINSLKFWPAVMAFTFAFVPFGYRNIFGGAVAVTWQTYLSYLNGRAERLEVLHQRQLAASAGTEQLGDVPLEEGKSSAAAAMHAQ